MLENTTMPKSLFRYWLSAFRAPDRAPAQQLICIEWDDGCAYGRLVDGPKIDWVYGDSVPDEISALASECALDGYAEGVRGADFEALLDERTMTLTVDEHDAARATEKRRRQLRARPQDHEDYEYPEIVD